MGGPIMRNFTARTFGAAAALSLLTMTGCNQLDPLKRPYMWQETDSNAKNIAAMAANPADLTRGQDSQRRRAAPDADSVVRLWTGKTVALPTDTPGSASGSSTATGGSASSGGGS
jgi:hypothetical protein